MEKFACKRLLTPTNHAGFCLIVEIIGFFLKALIYISESRIAGIVTKIEDYIGIIYMTAFLQVAWFMQRFARLCS
jgi:hypothetical protein